MNASSLSPSLSANPAPPPIQAPSHAGARLDLDPSQKPGQRSRVFWSCLVLLVALGSLGLSPQFISLWNIWTIDPLRSIGMLIVPASFILILRIWWQSGWELRGTWWGLLPIAMAFFSIIFSQNLTFSWGAGPQTVNFFPHVLPLYLYASGVILLFAGFRIWKVAWFPLALLLFAQPVPAVVVHLFDLPLQNLSARIARSFATMIGFPPSSSEVLRLMFSPDFGMFIAPGCDGMRGAVTLGYGALIVGYLKRVSALRWILYVVGAVILGHIFNLLRLCTLVLYYRVALGHPALEQVAKQADYVIGATLFLLAGLIFFWAVLRKDGKAIPETEASEALETSESSAASVSPSRAVSRQMVWKIAVFAVIVGIAAVPGVRAIKINRQSLAAYVPSGNLTPQELDERIPKRLGNYTLTRSWQEQSSGVTVLEVAAYSAPSSSETTIGIWLPATGHSIHDSWTTHGESPEMRADKTFITADGRPVTFDTAMYSDGETDTLAGSTNCTPSFCKASVVGEGGMHLGFTKASDFTTRGVRFVPIFFRIERLHKDGAKADIYNQLTVESQNFLSGVDFSELSQNYQ
jgi:exosortase J